MGKRSEHTPHQGRRTDGKPRMKRCPISCAVGEMQMRTRRHHFAPIGMTKAQDPGNAKRWRSRGATELPLLLVCMQDGAATWKAVSEFFSKRNTLVQMLPPHSLVLTQISRRLTSTQKPAYYSRFVAALLAIAQTDMSFTGEWIKELR